MIFPWSVAIRWSIAMFASAATNPAMSGRVFSSIVDECGPKGARDDGDDETPHLDISAYVLDGCRIFDHRQLVRLGCNQAEQETKNSKQWTHVG